VVKKWLEHNGLSPQNIGVYVRQYQSRSLTNIRIWIVKTLDDAQTNVNWSRMALRCGIQSPTPDMRIIMPQRCWPRDRAQS